MGSSRTTSPPRTKKPQITPGTTTLRNLSRIPPETLRSISPLSKGAREQGSKGEGGVGGNGSGAIERSSTPPASRPDGLHLIPDDFAITDAERRWANATFSGLDLEFETEQFIRYWRSEGRRKRNWHDAWQKWIADSAKRDRDRQKRGADVIPFAARQQQQSDDLFDRAMARAKARMQQESS